MASVCLEPEAAPGAAGNWCENVAFAHKDLVCQRNKQDLQSLKGLLGVCGAKFRARTSTTKPFITQAPGDPQNCLL